VPAERADDFELLAIDNGDVVSQVGTETHMVATVQKELPPREHSFEYVPERFRLSVARLFLLGHGSPLLEKESPHRRYTGRGSRCIDLGLNSLWLTSHGKNCSVIEKHHLVLQRGFSALRAMLDLVRPCDREKRLPALRARVNWSPLAALFIPDFTEGLYGAL